MSCKREPFRLSNIRGKEIQRDIDIWKRTWTSVKVFIFRATVTTVPSGAIWSAALGQAEWIPESYDRSKSRCLAASLFTGLLEAASKWSHFVEPLLCLKPQKPGKM